VVGVGGIVSTDDALEFLVVGATAVQVGTALFRNPRAGAEIVDGIARFLAEQRLSSVAELVGSYREQAPPPGSRP
jgi:dihydroorotate dehydrogenase (NAD+) catalytic subunit